MPPVKRIETTILPRKRPDAAAPGVQDEVVAPAEHDTALHLARPPLAHYLDAVPQRPGEPNEQHVPERRLAFEAIPL